MDPSSPLNDDTWTARPADPLLLRPRPEAARTGHASAVEVPLDDVQKGVVALAPDRSVLVLGEAGCGKTTVALHRLAAPAARAVHEGRRFRAVVIVPTEGLRRLSKTLVERLGVERVEVKLDVKLYDRWAGDQARRVFDKLPARESTEARPAVLRVKRHPSLRTALARLARRPPRPGKKTHATRRDLLLLFGDKLLLERVAEESKGSITPGAIKETLEHTRIQFLHSTEEEFAHVDAERLQAVDERGLDEGTPMEDADTVDVEDYAVLFELDRMRAEAHGQRPAAPRAYDCIVLDEAQELAPLELSLIGRSLAPGGALIVAGDAGQQVDPTASFIDWPTTMRELRAEGHATTTLEVSYRCPPAVTALARRILGDPTRGEHDHVDIPYDDNSVVLARTPTEVHLVSRLIDALAEIRHADPLATAAVICRTRAAATRMARILSWGVDVQLALDGDFTFAPGVHVTSVEEVKGLEFDYVVVPDASAAAYPDTADARRALYVAVTRTVHQLLCATVGTWSPIVPG